MELIKDILKPEQPDVPNFGTELIFQFVFVLTLCLVAIISIVGLPFVVFLVNLIAQILNCVIYFFIFYFQSFGENIANHPRQLAIDIIKIFFVDIMLILSIFPFYMYYKIDKNAKGKSDSNIEVTAY